MHTWLDEHHLDKLPLGVRKELPTMRRREATRQALVKRLILRHAWGLGITCHDYRLRLTYLASASRRMFPLCSCLVTVIPFPQEQYVTLMGAQVGRLGR